MAASQFNQMIFNYVWEFYVERKWISGTGEAVFPTFRDVARGIDTQLAGKYHPSTTRRMVQIIEAVKDDPDMDMTERSTYIVIRGLKESVEQDKGEG